jgi:gliding motility-associated-like protein
LLFALIRFYLLTVKNVMIVLLVLLSGHVRSQVFPVTGQRATGTTTILSDPNLPHLKSVVVECTSKVLIVVLSKNIKCFSLSADGSEFTISPLVGSILTTSANSCVFSTNIDTVWITLSDVLPPGDYSLTIKNGTDDNTLVDEFSKQIPDGESIAFTVLPPVPTPLDSLSPVACAPDNIQLVFSDQISCSSIAADGSDFNVTGVPVAGISKVEGECINGFTRIIHITLNSPILSAGNYQIRLAKGSDGNTLVNECGTETPAGATISFNTKDAVSALFSFDIAYGCKYDTIALHYLPNGADEWRWYIDSAFAGSSLTPSLIENVFGPRNVQHIVSNGVCSDTVTEVINLDNVLKAGFQAPAEVCPKDLISFNNVSIGKIVSWNWDFGDGSFSALETPVAHQFPETWVGKTYHVSLVVQNDLGCYDTLTTPISKMQSCYITVPSGFTPNGDGKNDYLYPLNAFQATDLEFRVYNRKGMLVFETRDWTRKWDGTIHGNPQATGSYVWTLSYTDSSSAKKFFLSGSSVLIR